MNPRLTGQITHDVRVFFDKIAKLYNMFPTKAPIVANRSFVNIYSRTILRFFFPVAKAPFVYAIYRAYTRNSPIIKM